MNSALLLSKSSTRRRRNSSGVTLVVFFLILCISLASRLSLISSSSSIHIMILALAQLLVKERADAVAEHGRIEQAAALAHTRRHVLLVADHLDLLERLSRPDRHQVSVLRKVHTQEVGQEVVSLLNREPPSELVLVLQLLEVSLLQYWRR
ncbi:hypothetical protein PG987_007390 [Apiospora arundinis]